MCGIAGVIGEQSPDWIRPVLSRMMDAIRHRGPDGDGQFLLRNRADSHTIALGHLRLAIVDLVTGDQPMTTQDGRYTLIYNGEIYNFVELREELRQLGWRFRTQSDSEVLLIAYAHWGASCLERLRGMFAFAIWDDAEQELFLARDPFGKKPLLYFRNGAQLVFGSEFAALAAHPDFDPAVDPSGIAQYLIYKYVPGSGTLAQSVKALPPGHYARWSNGALRIERYYAPPLQARPEDRLAMSDATVDRFGEELTEAVRLRLRSDVPLGAFLSGGIDSSAIVAIMARETGQTIRTFSIGFEEKEYSELWAARKVAQAFSTDHHEIRIAPTDFLEGIERISWLRGAPLSEMADVPVYYLSKLAAEHVKVVLSGEGADELIAGYPKHWGELWANRYQSVVPGKLDKVLLDLPRKVLPFGQRRLGVALRAARERSFLNRQASWFGLMTREDAATLAPQLFATSPPFAWDDDPGDACPPLHRALRFDKTVWLPATLLQRGDRMTMAASIEARMPFMDTKLTEFVSRLPDAAFLSGQTGKAILRRSMAGTLPPEILARRKWGFHVPIHQWLRGPMRDYLNDMLLGDDAQLASYLDRGVLTRMIAEHQAMRHNREKELWALLSLEVFLRQLSRHAAVAV